MHNVLKEIVERKKKDLKEDIPPHNRPYQAPIKLNQYFSPGTLNIIAEIKFSSPALKGKNKNTEFIAPEKLALEYFENGAKAVSILTEEHYFNGSLDYLEAVKKSSPQIPLLMKDFIISPSQISEGYNRGADAILLIAAILSEKQIKELYDYSQKLGLSVLVEVHNQEDLEKAMALSPQIIGINNRNLKTLEIDLNTTKELIPNIPEHITRISESGISTALQLKELSSQGVNGFLIGNSLMTTGTPSQALKKLVDDFHVR